MISAKDVFMFMFPGIMYFWVFFIGQGPMQEILDERDNLTLQRILASPANLLQFLLSKIIRCFLICGSIQLLLLLASTGFSGVQWGNPFLLVPVVLICALSVTGLLTLIYALAKTKEQANAMSHVVVLIWAFLGGSFFPFEQFPEFLRAIGHFSPNRWAILAIQTVAFARPRTNLILPVVVLCAIGLIGSITALILFHRRLATGGRR